MAFGVLGLGGSQARAQRSRAGGEPDLVAAPRSVGLLPMASRWVPASVLAVVLDTLAEIGREEGLTVIPLDGVDSTACWGDDRW